MTDSTDAVSREATDATNEVTFLQYHAPPLQDGRYRIDVAQTVFDQKTKIDGPYEAEYEFVVEGKQFQLPGSPVHSVYPPQGSTGDYGGHLPHIVLDATSFPWQRAPGGEATTPPATWLALLLFDATEGLPKTKQGTVADLKDPPSDVFFPYDNIEKGPTFDPSTACRYVDVDAALFNKVAPSVGDLPYLAHVRKTDTTQQPLDHTRMGSMGTASDPAAGGGGDPSTNEYAVVVGTRLPKAALEREKGDTPTQNEVHLVSLEGYGPHLPTPDGTSRLPSGMKAVRLVTFHHWTFNAATHTYKLWKVLHNTPEQAATRTVKDPETGTMTTKKADNYTDTSPPALHLPADELESAVPAHAQDAVRAGFTPMMYQTRTGDEAAAWYRGPLAPLPVDTGQVEDTVDHADQLLHFDEDTGMFDVSYAVAYQIGRLLALHDAHAAEAIAQFRAAKVRRTRQALSRLQLFDAHPPTDEASPEAGIDAAEFQSGVVGALADTLSAFLDDLE